MNVYSFMKTMKNDHPCYAIVVPTEPLV